MISDKLTVAGIDFARIEHDATHIVVLSRQDNKYAIEKNYGFYGGTQFTIDGLIRILDEYNVKVAVMDSVSIGDPCVELLQQAVYKSELDIYILPYKITKDSKDRLKILLYKLGKNVKFEPKFELALELALTKI